MGKDISVVVNRKYSFLFNYIDLTNDSVIYLIYPGFCGDSHKEDWKCTRRLGKTIMSHFVSQVIFLLEEGKSRTILFLSLSPNLVVFYLLRLCVPAMVITVFTSMIRYTMAHQLHVQHLIMGLFVLLVLRNRELLQSNLSA